MTISQSRATSEYTEQITDADELSAIHAEMRSAQQIVFLGFAFHDQNMQLLMCNEAPDTMPVYGTAYGMSDDDTSVVTRQIKTLLAPPETYMQSFPDRYAVKIKRDLTAAGLFEYFAKSLASDV